MGQTANQARLLLRPPAGVKGHAIEHNCTHCTGSRAAFWLVDASTSYPAAPMQALPYAAKAGGGTVCVRKAWPSLHLGWPRAGRDRVQTVHKEGRNGPASHAHLLRRHLHVAQREVQQVLHGGAQHALVPLVPHQRQHQLQQLRDEVIKLDALAVCAAAHRSKARRSTRTGKQAAGERLCTAAGTNMGTAKLAHHTPTAHALEAGRSAPNPCGQAPAPLSPGEETSANLSRRRLNQESSGHPLTRVHIAIGAALAGNGQLAVQGQRGGVHLQGDRQTVS